MKIVKLITKATHQSIVDAMISIAIAHGLTITNVENIMTDVIAYLKDNATVKKVKATNEVSGSRKDVKIWSLSSDIL